MNDMSGSTPNALTRIRNAARELERWEPEIMASLAYAHDSHSFDDIVEGVFANKFFFFSFETSFTLMQLLQYPRYRVYHCFLAGGDLEGVLASIVPMSEVARQLNCKYLSMSGRKGWAKPLSLQGWSHIATTMYLEM